MIRQPDEMMKWKYTSYITNNIVLLHLRQLYRPCCSRAFYSNRLNPARTYILLSL